MNVRFYAAIALFTLLAGCRQDPYMDAHIDMLHAEYRALEDDYEELKHHYYIAKAEADELRKQPAQTTGVTSDADDDGSPLEFGGPNIDLGTPVDPMDLNQPDGAQAPIRDPNVMQTVALSPDLTIIRPVADDLPPEPLDMQVTHIVINPYLTGGHDFDRKPGDDGVSIVIEPRNADDQFVPQTGAVRIAVIDPAVEGDEAYVAEWNFDAEETKRRLKRGRAPAGGFTSSCRGRTNRPNTLRLRVFVRYQSEQGELSDDEELYAALPGEFSHRWTPKSAGQAQSDQFTGPANFTPAAARYIDAMQLPRLDGLRETDEVEVVESLEPTPKQVRRPEWQPFR